MSETGGAGVPEHQAHPPRIDSSVAHNARVWNYWLGGKDNFEPDRRVGDHIRRMFPVIGDVARADRRFLARAVGFLAGEVGIRQFLDIGTGLPTADNTHDLAQAIAPASRIVYVDNDPMVLVHARALLTSHPEGATSYLDADIHAPDTIVAAAARTLDLDRPVAVMMLGILNFVLDDDEAQAIVAQLMAAVPPGSYLALTHPTAELGGEMNVPAMAFWNEHAAPPIRARSGAEVARFCAGLELVEPGLVSCSRWRAGPDDTGTAPVPQYAVVARKP
ncbi:SAM-dependent methyltransferase [Micromonospora echinofusca]|uniref:SAM-dependent methyltransferase n=1 Tax=Micromonospora echinofusca TaxID=47858 RepID=A0ABS3VU93_MICEH|nr:SAM-dependent methyltransferase [Micromonospora echinofusca]MBO4207964.1 SAM-dependent methyltransferase [Micromonospora echinofusca]